MKNIKFSLILLTIIAATGFISCKVQEEPTVVVAPRMEPIAFIVQEVSKGVLTGNGEEGIAENQSFIIQTAGEWEDLRTKMNAVNETIGETSIDFDKNTLLAYFDKIRPTGGYSVSIFEVLKSDRGVQANYRFGIPGEMAIDIMTQPYHIILIPKTTTPIQFIRVTE
jgi:hypothetical protein